MYVLPRVAYVVTATPACHSAASFGFRRSSTLPLIWYCMGVKKFDHISTAMEDELQWLRIGERINFKLCILITNV